MGQYRGIAVAKVSVEQALAKAKSHIKKGETAEAQALYVNILKAFPNNKKAQQGLITLGGGQRSASEQGPPQAVIDQLMSLYKQGRLEAVVAQAKDLTAQFPKVIALWNMLGASAAQIGKLDQAVHAFDKMISINPNEASSYYNLGNALQEQGKLKKAIEAYNKAIALKSDYAEAHNNIGLALQELGNLDEAIEAYNKAIALKSDNTVTYNNIGNVLKEQGKLEEAIRAYNKAITLKSDYAEAFNNMGVALQELGKLKKAIEAYNKAIAIKSDYAEAHYNMGIILQVQGKLKKAIEAYDKAIALKSDYAEAYNNIGLALQGLGKLDEAIEAYNKALNIKSDYAAPHHNMSLTLLAAKDFDQGFKQNEWRWETKEFKGKYLTTSKPMWNSEKKQRILVWGEQGIGDEIMFSSIIPEIYAASSQILVKCDKRLIPLFERSFPTDITYYSLDAHVPEGEYDLHIPMGSLPLTFRKSLDSFKNSASGFLKCNTDRAESIKSKLTYEPGKKLVGISWTTKSALKNASNRNINLADLARAFVSSNTQLVCLQYGDVSNEIGAVKRDFGIDVIQFGDVDNKNDIDGLASLMGACDMVFTIDNATAHLSGALGVPTKLMLPYIADWRWSIAEESSYWYGALQLYRQSKVNDWHSVLALITQVARA